MVPISTLRFPWFLHQHSHTTTTATATTLVTTTPPQHTKIEQQIMKLLKYIDPALILINASLCLLIISRSSILFELRVRVVA